jgi:hypothetical protein
MITLTRKTCATLIATLLCLGCLNVAQADFRRDYVLGKKDLSKENWEKAANRFRSAIEGKAEENQNERLSSTGFAPYLPYYSLGLALQGMGDCAGAAQAWQNSLQQGVVQNMADEHAKIQAGLQVCQPQDIDVSPYVAQANSALNALNEASDSYAALATGGDSGFVREWPAQWLPALDGARRSLADLRNRLSAAENRQDVQAIEAITTAAVVAKDALQGRYAEATTRISVLQEQAVQLAADRAAEDNRKQLAAAQNVEEQRKQEERRKAQAAEEAKRLAAIAEREEAQKQAKAQSDALQRREKIASAQRALRTELGTTGDLLAVNRGDVNVSNFRRQLASLTQTAQGQLTSESVTDLENQTQAIRDGVRKYRQAVQEWEAGQLEIARRTPPPELKRVADAYFAGDYEIASRLADPAKFTDPRQKIQAHLFRSASLFNLCWLAGGDDLAMLARAGQDVAAIKRLNGNFSPYVAAFSPKFLEFYQES